MDTFELNSYSDLYYLDLSHINEKIYLCDNLIILQKNIKLLEMKIIKNNINNKLKQILKNELDNRVLKRNKLIKIINPSDINF